MAAKQGPVTLSPDQLNDTDRALLDLLREGRVTPRYAADEIGKSRPYASDRLKRLVEHDHVSRLASGLYQVESDPRADEDDERPNVPTREIVDDWLWEHYGFGVDDVEAAQESLGQLLAARERGDPDAAADAVDELDEALEVARDE